MKIQNFCDISFQKYPKYFQWKANIFSIIWISLKLFQIYPVHTKCFFAMKLIIKTKLLFVIFSFLNAVKPAKYEPFYGIPLQIKNFMNWRKHCQTIITENGPTKTETCLKRSSYLIPCNSVLGGFTIFTKNFHVVILSFIWVFVS